MTEDQAKTKWLPVVQWVNPDSMVWVKTVSLVESAIPVFGARGDHVVWIGKTAAPWGDSQCDVIVISPSDNPEDYEE